MIVRASLNGPAGNRRGPIEVYEARPLLRRHRTPASPARRRRSRPGRPNSTRYSSGSCPPPAPVKPQERQTVPVDLDDREACSSLRSAAKNGAAHQGALERRYKRARWGRRPRTSRSAAHSHSGPGRIWRASTHSSAALDLCGRSGTWDERRGESTYGAQTIARALGAEPSSFGRQPRGQPSTSKEVILDATAGEPSPGKPDRRLDDIGNASRFVDQHGDALRYVKAWKEWLVYDGRRWAEDEVLLEPLRRAKLTWPGARPGSRPRDRRRDAPPPTQARRAIGGRTDQTPCDGRDRCGAARAATPRPRHRPGTCSTARAVSSTYTLADSSRIVQETT